MCEPAAVHTPVLVEPLLRLLSYPADGVLVDATVGQGGHGRVLGERLGPEGFLIGLDVDQDSLVEADRKLKGVPYRVVLERENFGQIDQALAKLQVSATNVILADLGVSSAQLAVGRRGMSYQIDGPLDMRLDNRLELNAADLVNKLRQDELADLIYHFGEERKSRRIARAIVEARKQKRIETTLELVEIINKSLGIKGTKRKYKIHPATRTFQALRIAVNDELGQLEKLLQKAPGLLKVGGQIAVISFHSLEDRLVKYNFRDNKKAGVYETLTAKPITADDRERSENPRSRSAKLRIARKIAATHTN